MNWQEHWPKFVAAVTAVILWFAISAERRERLIERTFDVPLALIGVPDDLIITNRVQESINVRLRGRVSQLRQISSATLEATVDLSDAREGPMTVTISPGSLNIRDDIEVVSIVPPQLVFRLEPRRQKGVPIRPFLLGEPPPGYRIGAILIEPAVAVVSGPESMLREYTEASTERIVLTGRNQGFTVNVGVVSDRSLVRIVDPTSARVVVPIEPARLLPPDEPAEPETTDQAPATQREGERSQ